MNNELKSKMEEYLKNQHISQDLWWVFLKGVEWRENIPVDGTWRNSLAKATEIVSLFFAVYYTIYSLYEVVACFIGACIYAHLLYNRKNREL